MNTFDVSKLKILPIENIRPCSWNPKNEETAEYKREYEKVKESLIQKGLRLPISVRLKSEFGTDYEIIDGEQRWKAWRELGNIDIIAIDEGEVSDQEAKELTIFFQQRVPFSFIEESLLISEMIESYNDLKLPYAEDEIIKMTDMADYNTQILLNDLNNAEINPAGGEVAEAKVKTLKVKFTEREQEDVLDAISRVKELQGIKKDSTALCIICRSYLAQQ